MSMLVLRQPVLHSLYYSGMQIIQKAFITYALAKIIINK